MALQNLHTYFSKVNREEFDNLLKLPCIVTEKVQASSFHVLRDDIDYKYFKSGKKDPLDLIDRTLIRYYEPAIKFFESIPQETREEMPANWKFGFDYMIEKKTVDIEYDHLPKNNLILTHIQVLSNADHSQIKKVIRDPKVLFKWADLLQVQRPSVIYNGVLQSDQKDQLINLMESSDEELRSKYESSSFARTIYSIFNKSLSKTALNDSLDQDIDSIVINFFDQKETKIFKICKEEKEEEKRKPSDSYQIALLDIVEFITQFNLNEIIIESDEADKRYIELICKLFNAYISKNAHKYAGISFDSAEFSGSEFFRVSTKFIDNTDTIEYIQDNDTLSQLFKIMLGSFRNKRKKETDVINNDLMNQINEIVDSINTIVMSKVESDDVMSFKGYILNNKLKNQKSPINESFFTFNEYIQKKR